MLPLRLRLLLSVLLLFAQSSTLRGQLFGDMPFLQHADTLHPGRFWTCAAGGAVIYTGVSFALWHSWYRDYELGPFHSFDDWGEWEHMDKWGHVFTAYNEANWSSQGARWTGMDRRKAMWTGVGVSMLLQSTVEVMDGFSEKWGFSWSDCGFNVLGAGVFVAQEMAWKEQRIVIKVSNNLPAYPDDLITAVGGGGSMPLSERAADLFGKPGYQRFLKDYNGQTYWVSANIHSFLKEESRFPKWLNLAFGYGAENMYAGFGYEWERDGLTFSLDPGEYPRYRQFFLAPDIDFLRIPTKSRLLKTFFGMLNFIKIPSPALELNTRGKFKLRALYW